MAKPGGSIQETDGMVMVIPDGAYPDGSRDTQWDRERHLAESRRIRVGRLAAMSAAISPQSEALAS